MGGKDFLLDFNQLLDHDRQQFKEPEGWQTRPLTQSPLLLALDEVWGYLSPTYEKELASLAYAKIPEASAVYDTAKQIFALFSSDVTSK